MIARSPLAGLLALAALAALPALPALAEDAAAAEASVAAAPEAGGGEAARPASSALPAITVSEVTMLPLRERVIASGLVAAVEVVQVQPLVEGQPIDALLADVGDRVEAGQALARLSTSTLELQLSQLAANRASVEAQIAQAEASLAQAESNAEEAERVAARNEELAAQGTLPRAQAEQTSAAAVGARAAVRVSEQGIEAARAQQALVEAQIANAELQLSRAEVTAPVAGLVVARNAQVGAIASAAGQPMFTLVRDGAMELHADLAEQDLLRVGPGQAVTLAAMQGSEPLSGTVRMVDPAIDPQTRLGRARITIDDPSRVLQGMFLTAEILVREAEMPAVPVTAVGATDGGATVMRVDDGVVHRVPVTIDIRDGGLVGVSEGLAPGDLVVTKAAAFVRDGDRINPVREEAGAQASAAPAPASQE